ncbi:MAG: PEP-CTERM sorting domain-containing protein [Chthonomonas sp.]|nr:PEP-CTERM sorting domain-containing protein [Chthonomonas sp.]
MKLNTRTFAFAVALGATVAANAQIQIYLGYADNATAAMNGVAVGTELKPVSKIGAVGSTFTVGVFIKNNGAKLTPGGGNTFLGFDTASTNNSSTGYASNAAAQTAGTAKKISLADAYVGSTGLDGFKTSDSSAASVDVQSGVTAAKFRGAQGSSTASMRSIGLNWGWGVGTGFAFNLDAGASLRVMTMVVTNKGIAAGDIFGDVATENGLTLNQDVAAGSAGTNYVGAGAQITYTSAGRKYALQAVPEPGTMIALGAALVGLAARRRKK